MLPETQTPWRNTGAKQLRRHITVEPLKSQGGGGGGANRRLSREGHEEHPQSSFLHRRLCRFNVRGRSSSFPSGESKGWTASSGSTEPDPLSTLQFSGKTKVGARDENKRSQKCYALSYVYQSAKNFATKFCAKTSFAVCCRGSNISW